jgi:hypothetical protein
VFVTITRFRTIEKVFSPAVVPFSTDTGFKEIHMSFNFPVILYFGPARQGQITFHRLFVKEKTDYTCEPANILVLDEAKELLRQIRQAPLSIAGIIGKYIWQV